MSVRKTKRELFDELSAREKQGWVHREREYWTKIDTQIKNQKIANSQFSTHPSLADSIHSYINNLEVFHNKLEPQKFVGASPERNEGLVLLADQIFEFNLPNHDDLLANDFLIACISGETASAIYTYRLLCNQPEQHYLRGYNEGITKNLSHVSEMVDRSGASTISDIEKKEEQLERKIKDAENTIERIFASAGSAIALSRPVAFWEERESRHRSNASKYGKYATRSAVIFAILLLVTVIYEYLSGTPHQILGYEFTLPKTLTGLATILLISTAGIWSTRIFVKLMMANLTMESESIERATMIKTFVAMKAAESSIAQEAELLFYTTLFRPSNNVISEDSTAPEFGKILDAILKSRPDKPSA